MTTTNYHLVIKEEPNLWKVEYHYPLYSGAEDFFQAFIFHARDFYRCYYKVAPSAIAHIALAPATGKFWTEEAGPINHFHFNFVDMIAYRQIHKSTHALTRQALTGLPHLLIENLFSQASNEKRFRIEASDGAFCLTPKDWWAYLRAGHDTDQLTHLGIELLTPSPRLVGEQKSLFD